MDLARLRVLCELADRGSVTATATAIGFTPSAVSQQLRTLERETRVTLVERVGRGVRLTPAGQQLVEHAHEVLAAVERAQSALDAHRSGVGATVRLAAFPSFARLLLPDLLARAATHGRRVEARDQEIAPATAALQLADHDLLVVHRDESSPPLHQPGVDVEPLVREPVDVVLPGDHPLVDRSTIGWPDLADEPFIGVQVGLPIDDLMRSLGTTTGVRPRVVQRVNDFTVTQALVVAGHGVALLPRYTVDASLPLVARPLAGVRAARQIDLLVRAGSGRRPHLRWTLDTLHELAGGLGWD
jgi:DNA-binding transcriptional LysR family regulator